MVQQGIKGRAMRSGALVALVGVSVLALAACQGGEKKAKDAKDPKAKTTAVSSQTVGVAIVSAQAVPRIINATGTISPWEEVPVGAETGGLTAISVNA